MLTIFVLEAVGLLFTLWILMPQRMHWVLRLFCSAMFAVGFWALIEAWSLPLVIKGILILGVAIFLVIWREGRAAVRYLAAALLILIGVMEVLDLIFHFADLMEFQSASYRRPSPWAVLVGFFALSVPALLMALGAEEKSWRDL